VLCSGAALILLCHQQVHADANDCVPECCVLGAVALMLAHWEPAWESLARQSLAGRATHQPLARLPAGLNGYFLDLVPQGAGKGAALEYIRQGYNWPHGLTVACGDSANDLLMFDAAPNVIVVGNSSDEAREWVARHRQMGEQGHAAMAGKRVYAAQQPAAAGIIEGLKGLGFVS
jgi:hypothetical protein